MREFTTELNIETLKLPGFRYSDEEILYFDIETTGFVPASTRLYLIGFVYCRKGRFYMTQWFADSDEAEKELLCSFVKFITDFRVLVHYNGSNFDIPYIIKKCSFLGIKCDMSGIASLDIYKTIQPVKCLFRLENLKQKSVESFVGFERTDKFSGGELINVYNEYIKSPDSQSLDAMLRHNREDVLGMLKIVPVIGYTCICDGRYNPSANCIKDSSASKKEVFLTLESELPVPVRVSCGNDLYYMTMYEKTIRICITAHTDELKYFYPNYKDYYYLPDEDRSIHKSVAFYVDKNYRTRAKAANCYSKKTGIFLPQSDEIIKPYFKIDYYDKITYFEYTDEFRNDAKMQKKYAEHIFRTLLKM